MRNPIWTVNPDLDPLMQFTNDPRSHYVPDKWESEYELVWLIDKRFNPLDEEVWALSLRPSSSIKGTKYIGYVTPKVFVDYNTDIPKIDLDIDQLYPAFYDLDHECAYELDPVHQPTEQMWVVKFRPTWRRPKEWKWVGTVKFELEFELNPELPEMEYTLEYDVPLYDFSYEHVWMLDPVHTENAVEDIWAVKGKLVKKPVGAKIIGIVSPILQVEYNSDIPMLDYDLEVNIPYHDFGYEYIWMLDSRHTKDAVEDIWAVKTSYALEPVGAKIVGSVSPNLTVTSNPNLPKLSYDIDVDIPYYDLGYEYTWLLDPKHHETIDEDIWAVRVSAAKIPTGIKIVGTISPNIDVRYNPALPKMKFAVKEAMQFHDLEYEHVWHIDTEFTQGKKVWAVKASAVDRTVGTKEMGFIKPVFEQLDVVFISYNEPNAEENWQRVLEKAPWAKRVDNVDGIFNAHKEAARVSETDMFYVVDGDAYLVDSWNFNFQPGIFDRDCAYVWSSKNPINNLTYQYGGVKLFSKSILMKQKKWTTLDMFTGIMPKIKAESKVSCITAFNTDEFSTWRSAFRECVKLSTVNQVTKLDSWLKKGKTKPFGRYAIAGAQAGYKYAVNNSGNLKALAKINDYNWLRAEFNKANI